MWAVAYARNLLGNHSRPEKKAGLVAKKRAQAMKSRFRSRFLPQVELSSQPDHALIDVITVPRDENSSPWRQLGKRVLWAFGIVVFVTIVVYVDGGGYSEDMS